MKWKFSEESFSMQLDYFWGFDDIFLFSFFSNLYTVCIYKWISHKLYIKTMHLTPVIVEAVTPFLEINQRVSI